MAIEKEALIKTKAIFSEDGRHRYLLSRFWNVNKKKAVVIMQNPSYADELKGDLSVFFTKSGDESLMQKEYLPFYRRYYSALLY